MAGAVLRIVGHSMAPDVSSDFPWDGAKSPLVKNHCIWCFHSKLWMACIWVLERKEYKLRLEAWFHFYNGRRDIHWNTVLLRGIGIWGVPPTSPGNRAISAHWKIPDMTVCSVAGILTRRQLNCSLCADRKGFHGSWRRKQQIWQIKTVLGEDARTAGARI